MGDAEEVIMTALLNSLNEAERDLIRETDRDRMAELTEDDLVDLHTRARRARNKYTKLYRRGASTQVAQLGGRGAARPTNRRNAGKAEIFEDALSRVSRRLAVVASQSAAALRAERLAAARQQGGGPARSGVRATAVKTPRTPSPTAQKSPARRKREASTLAAGARRQAARDAR
ncbi:MAG: hypothetical protein JWO63_760 [Frankiales bacterium]|jgi:hypothetical protein|nr:hypothetical protein [Frankiales bacterium]